MPLPTPISNDVPLVTYTIKVEGAKIDDSYLVHSIETYCEINTISYAKITIYDGTPAEGKFEISETATFLPGKEVEIDFGYESKEKPVFKGVIVKQGIQISGEDSSMLIVIVKDKAVKMTLGRKNNIYNEITDSDLIGKLIGNNGLGKDVEATTVQYEKIVQYYATDWDLMLMRAEINGLIVTLDYGKVVVKKPDTSQTPVVEVSYGSTIYDLRADMHSESQVSAASIKGASWDYTTQKLFESGAGSVGVTEQGNYTSATLAKVFNISDLPLQTGAGFNVNSLKGWATAEIQRSMLSKITGTVSFQGMADVKPGVVISLAGVGARFNGKAFISSVKHTVREGNWVTEAGFGMSFKWFSEQRKDIESPNASGLLPAIRGLQTGIVKKVATDPDSEFRVFVELPLLNSENKQMWARLATFYTTPKGGSFFMPETDDEVVIGFMNDDPNDPIILGSLYSKNIDTPFDPDEDNTKKAIYTKGELKVLFDDKDKIITISTPADNIVTLDDKAKKISLADCNNNTIVMSDSGITIDSASSIKITAKEDITINAGTKLTEEAKTDVSISGQNIKADAKMDAAISGLNIKADAKMDTAISGTNVKLTANLEFAAKGLTSTLEASTMTTVKGALVKIN